MHPEINNTVEYLNEQQELNALIAIGIVVTLMFIATYFIGETK